MASEGITESSGACAGRAAAWLAKQVELGLAETGLSLPQYRMLGLLSEGSSMPSALAERLAVRPPSVSAMVDGMVGRGLIERRHNDDDRRTVSHQLTPGGHDLLSRADRAVDTRLAAVAGSLADEEQTSRALGSLQLWLDAIQAHRLDRLAAR